MKKARHFIIRFLKQIAQKFPESAYRYEHDIVADVHVIEVTPSEFAMNDKDFAEEQFHFVSEFLQKFPDDEICFVTENDLLRVADPIFEISPVAKLDVNLEIELGLLLDRFSIKWSDLHLDTSKLHLETSISVAPKHVTLEQLPSLSSCLPEDASRALASRISTEGEHELPLAA